MADTVLGIDFGTSNTVAALARPGAAPVVLSFDGHRSLPSAVYLQDDKSLVVGRDAERLARLAPERFEPNPKRRIDDVDLLLGIDVISVQTAFSAVLQRVAAVAADALQGRTPTRVNLTHPADWGTNRRRLLSAAARDAGLGNVTLIPEPIAAATHFGTMPGHTLSAGSTLAVYDLGGGTFDCAVVQATATGYLVLAEGGLPDVGGVDFDQSVLEHLGRSMAQIDSYHWQSLAVPQTAAARRSSRRLREDIRSAKESLSRAAQTDVPLPDPFPDALLTRGEVEGLIRPAIIRTVTQLQRTIREAGCGPDQLAGIYLVGGSSRIPLVAAAIADRTGVVPVSLEEPETTVALGAALARGVTTNKSGPQPAAAAVPSGPVPSGAGPSGPVPTATTPSGGQPVVPAPFGMTPIDEPSDAVVRGLPAALAGTGTRDEPVAAETRAAESAAAESRAIQSRAAESLAAEPVSGPGGVPVYPATGGSPGQSAAAASAPTPSRSPAGPGPVGAPPDAPAVPSPRPGSPSVANGPITSVPSVDELRYAAVPVPPVPQPAATDPVSRFGAPGTGVPLRHRPPPAESEALAAARASVGQLLGAAPVAPRRSRRGWWLALVVIAVLAVVTFETVMLIRDDDDAGAPAGGAETSGTASAEPGLCPPPGDSEGLGPCLTKATARASSGPLALDEADATKVDAATRAVISEAQPVDQVTLTGRSGDSGPEVLASFVQLENTTDRDELFSRLVEDLDGQPESYDRQEWSGRMVQAMVDGQPRVVCVLDTVPVVIQLSADPGTKKSMDAAELAQLFLDEVSP